MTGMWGNPFTEVVALAAFHMQTCVCVCVHVRVLGTSNCKPAQTKLKPDSSIQ